MYRIISNRVFWIAMIVGLLAVILQISAQSPQVNSIIYGDTVYGIFDGSQQGVHIWRFTAQEGEIFGVRVQRIGGQFAPEFEVYDGNGNPLVADHNYYENVDHIWRFYYDDIPATGEYSIQITGETNQNAINPNEYTLTLYYEGIHLKDLNSGMVALPTRNASDMPDIQSAPSKSNDMGLPIYGTSAKLTQPDIRNQKNRWIINGNGFSIDIDNANPLNRGLQSISIVDSGVGFTTLDGASFFADSSISSLTYKQSLTNITLQDGRTLVTDFYRIQQIQFFEELVIVTTTKDQRLIFTGQNFEFLRRGGVMGEGPNIESINLFLVDGHKLETDLSNWHTLYYNTDIPEMRILYGSDLRFVSSYLDASIKQRGNQEKPELNEAGLDTNYIDNILHDPNERSRDYIFQIDPFGMGDFIINPNEVIVKPLDGRVVTESTSAFVTLLVENRGLRFALKDSSYRLVLPDSTDIHSPSVKPDNRNALPNDPSYRPNNANNLGTYLYDYHPTMSWDEFITPVNPINGNLFYSVSDISVDSHTLELAWTRYYNSLSPEYLTPEYYLTGQSSYLFGKLGPKWRHSYQYDLDIRYAPLDEVWLTLPDGSRHIFSSSKALDNPNPVFRSQTLMSWEIYRQNGVTGTWLAKNGDGEIYEFDRAGRLERIYNTDGNSLLFSSAPQELAQKYGYAGGFFITELYGRRIEVYTDTNNVIKFVRQQFEYTYDHDDAGYLFHVEYPSILQNEPDNAPNYTYSADGLLITIRDKRSPYHAEMHIDYTPSKQVQSWVINDNARGGTAPVVTDIVYEPGRTTSRIRNDAVPQDQIIGIDTNNRIVEYTLTDGIDKRTRAFTYEVQTGRLYQVRQLSGARYSYTFDDRGYLTKLSTPSIQDYNFEYFVAGDGVTRKLLSIQYPNKSIINYFYNEDGQLIGMTQPLDKNRIIQTRYEYDENGRIKRISKPNPAQESTQYVTEFSYDAFGYLTQVQVFDSSIADVRLTLQTMFDISGRLIEMIDWRGQPISIEWDNQRDLMLAFTYGDVSRLINRTEYLYDEYSNMVERRSQDLIETFTYNGFNLVASSTDGMGRVSHYQYDIFGNLIEQTVPAGDVNNDTTVKIYRYLYNGVNEVTAYFLSDEEPYTISYSVEGTGVPTSFTVRTPQGQAVTYTYNVNDLLTRVTHQSVAGNIIYDYILNYDSMGNLITIQEAYGRGRSLQIDYNNLNLPTATRIGTFETVYNYNHAGKMNQMTNPDGVVTQYSYDFRGNIVNVILPNHDFLDSTPLPMYQYQYDEAGNLIAFIDALGEMTNYNYDELNRLISVTNPLGYLTEYEYDSRDNIIGQTAPNGNTLRAEYNAANYITRWINDSAEFSYLYDRADRLIQITDPNQIISTFTYDILDNLVAKSVTESRETLFSYDNANRQISETNALGQTVTYNYNNLNSISRIIDSMGNIEYYTWTGDGYLNIHANKTGESYEYAYDPIGRLQQINTPGQLERFIMTYSNSGLVESIQYNVEKLADDFEFTYYPNGLLASLKSPETEYAWEFVYDEMQHLVTLTTPEGDQFYYEYDALGQMTRLSYPDGATKEWTYDSIGNMVQYVAPSGMISTLQYDTLNRVSIRTDESDGYSRQYSYSYSYIAPQLVIVDSGDQRTEYYYDDFGNIVRIDAIGAGENDESQSIRYTFKYDSVNNLLEVQYPAIDNVGTQPSIRFSYNALNQLTRYLDLANNSWAYGYDEFGNLNQVNDPLGNIVNYEYDSYNRIISVRYNSGAHAVFRYNVRANTLSAPENHTKDQENRTPILYSFDINNNLIEIEHTPSSKIIFIRDDLGRVNQIKTANSEIIQLDYNYLNQITSIKTPSETITRQYDGSGHLTGSSSENHSIEFTYDGFGYLTQSTQSDVAVQYHYDVVGLLQSVDSSLTGLSTFEYDTLYRLNRIESDAESVTFSHNDIGWTTQFAYDAGVNLRYIYTPQGRVGTFTAIAGQNNFAFKYLYDAGGNVIRTTRSDGLADGSRITRDTLYTYGHNNELIGERWLNENNEVVYATTYIYDLSGNRIQSITSNTNNYLTRTIYIYNQYNQLTEELRGVPPDIFDRYTGEVVNIGGKADERIVYTYDNAGNLKTLTHPQGTLTYRYDAWNRLIAVTGINEAGESISTDIKYDSLGRLYKMNIDQKRYTFIYNQNLLTAIRNDTDGTVETYIYDLKGVLLWRTTPNGLQYPIIDGLGHIRLWIDSSGASIDGTRGISLNGFGEIITPYGDHSSPIENNRPYLLYDGQIFDPSSGLYFIGERAYLPVIGRFIQRDPIRHDPQNSLYTFRQNRPTYLLDTSLTDLAVDFTESQNSQFFTETVISRPLFEDTEYISDMSRVMQIQALEDARLLQIADMVKHELNSVNIGIDNHACLNSLGGLNYIIANMESDQTFPALEQNGKTNTWIPNGYPSPNTPIQRDVVLQDVNQYIGTTFSNGRIWLDEYCDWAVNFSESGLVLPLSNITIHENLRNLLYPNSLYQAFAEEVPVLLSGVANEPSTPSAGLVFNKEILPIPILMPQSLHNIQLDTYQLVHGTIMPLTPWKMALEWQLQGIDNIVVDFDKLNP